MRMKAGEEDRQAGGRGGKGVGGQEGQRGRTKKESRQRGRGGAEMKSARSHLFFVNRWVEVSDCDESQSTTGTCSTHMCTHFSDGILDMPGCTFSLNITL